MQRISVKEMAVALSDYATVSDKATLYDAIMALHRTRDQSDPDRPRHRAILVVDRRSRVVGKIGYVELLQALEPKYAGMGKADHGGPFTSDFIKSQLQKYSLWQHPLDDLCRKAARFRVSDFMHRPAEAEFIDENATLDEAVHRFIMVRTLSLLLRRGDAVVGILRLSDVVEKIGEMIRVCQI